MTLQAPDFDATKIVQYGYVPQYQDHLRYIGSFWRPGRLVAEDGKTAQIPEAWAAAWKWYYDGMWSDQPFIPNYNVTRSPEFGAGNPFNGGKIAMAATPLWYTCCIGDAGESWDIGALPSYDGKVTPASTPIPSASEGHQEPGRRLRGPDLLHWRRVVELLGVYGGMPGRTSSSLPSSRP